MLNQPHWLFIAIFGALIGAILPYLSKVAKFFFRKFSRSHFLGEWYLYVCCSKDYEQILTKSLISIKNGILQKYKVKVRDDTVHQYFCGTAFIEHNNLCIVFRSTSGFEETVFHKYDMKTPSNKDILYGLYLGYDYDLKVSSGCSILSKAQLSDNVLSQHIRNVYNIKNDAPFINI